MPARRRANGDGSLYQDATGRWHAHVIVGISPTGKPVRRHVSGPTRAIVKGRLDELLDQATPGTVVNPTRYTVDSWLAHWVNVSQKTGRIGAKTADTYRYAISSIISGPIGKVRLDRLTAPQVEAAWIAAGERGLASVTVLKAHRILSRALTVAVRQKVVRENVCQLIDAPSGRTRKVVGFTLEDARKLIAGTVDHDMHAAWLLATFNGLRRGELASLRWEHLNLDDGTVTIAASTYRSNWQHGPACDCPPKTAGRDCNDRTGGGVQEGAPKTTASEARLPVARFVVDALRRHRLEQRQAQLLLGPRWRGDAGERQHVFTYDDGRGMGPDAIARRWATALTAVGLEHRGMHALRHTYSSQFVGLALHPKIAQEGMRHSDPLLALKVYQDVESAALRDAIDRIADRFTDSG